MTSNGARYLLVYATEHYGEISLNVVKCYSLIEAKYEQRRLRQHKRVVADSFELYSSPYGRVKVDWYKKGKNEQ